MMLLYVLYFAPGGGLHAHEGVQGAHPVGKHVEKSRAFLERRAREQRRVPGFSTFFSQADAEIYVARTITANQNRVDSWLRKADRHPLLLISQFDKEAVGAYLNRATNRLEVCRKVYVSLRKRPCRSGFPFTIHTAYIEP